MKSSILLILILSAKLAAVGQIDSDYVTLINTKMRSIQAFGTLHYADRPTSTIINKDASYLAKKKFKSFRNDVADTILILTPIEIKYIRSRLLSDSKKILPRDLFDNAERIAESGLVQLVDSINRRLIDSVSNIHDSLESIKARQQTSLNWAFFFSSPIYLRHKTILLSHFTYFQHGGSHSLAFYKRENGVWKQWILVSGGEW